MKGLALKYVIRRIFVFLVLPALVLGGGTYAFTSCDLSSVGKPAVPHWVPSGEPIPPSMDELLRELPDKAQLLFVFTWADDCGYCHLSAPVLQESYNMAKRMYTGQVEIWSMNIGGDGDDTIIGFAEKHKMTMPQIGGFLWQSPTPITYVFARNPDTGQMMEIQELHIRGQLRGGEIEGIIDLFFTVE